MQKHIACGNIDASVELVQVSRLRAAGLHFESKTMEGACEGQDQDQELGILSDGP